MPHTVPIADTSVPERLDRLPYTRRHSRILIGSGIGWTLDAMDVGLISFIIAALIRDWGIDKGTGGLIASVGFVGMAIGASVGGLLADRLGRRSVFALTLLIYGVATGASALAGGVAVLLVLRFFVGLGLGAELPVASTYVGEFAPARIRGRLVVILEAFWALGWTASAVIGYLVIPASSAGWRWAFALGAVPAAYAIVVRLRLPESARWLARRGRHAEADRVTATLEAAAYEPRVSDGGVTPGGTLRRGWASRLLSPARETQNEQVASHAPPSEAPAAAPAVARAATPLGRNAGARLAALFSHEFRRRTVALWAVWVCVNFAYYGAFIWIPSILVDDGYDLVRSFGFTLIITLAQLPGYAAAAWLIEVWGRPVTLTVFLAGSAGSALGFGTAHGAFALVAFGMALSFFNLGAWGVLYAVTPEIYPTSLRATAAGWAAAIGRVASIAAPLTVPVLLVAGGAALTFTVFALFFLVAAAASWGLASPRGARLDER
ncbi:MAG TPA: MFS transporter [Microbacteriaceae bacterium]|nr:MFS transporter [Microbacteriaceae bacterium]